MKSPHYYFLIMEKAQSVLSEKLNFPEKEGKVLLRQIVEGLKYCHDRGIAHRDLKCENILMTSDNIPKLADFGIATSLKNGDLTSTYCGSPNYMAPEILQMMPYDAFKADIWSLGVLLYMVVTGHMPYDPGKVRLYESRLSQIQEQQVFFPPTLSDPCRDLISSMLSMDPNKRPAVDQILQHPWLGQ
ncbi:testis-specific serine/threonine-protein kinase 3-like [Discoglossus pictus]